MNRSVLIIAALSLLYSCTTPSRKLASVDSLKTLTAKDLFLEGNFDLHKRKNRPFDEDHFGKELDLSQRRPSVNLNHSIFGQKYAKDGFQVIGNFYHLKQFWIVRVPSVGVKNIYMHISYFPPIVLGKYIAAHTLLRFRFDESTPIEIVAPMPDQKELARLNSMHAEDALSELPEPFSDDPKYILRDVALSAEAQWTKDDPKAAYDLVRGENAAYVQITRFESVQTRMWDFFSSGNPQVQIEFGKISDPDKVLNEGFKLSEREGLHTFYDTLLHNCTTTAFKIIELGTGKKDKRFLPIFKFLQTRVPTLSRSKIKYYDGLPATDMVDDETLRKDWLEVYQREFEQNKKPICADGMIKRHCDNVNKAVEKMKSWKNYSP